MQTISIPLLSDTTIYKIQKLLIPAINHVLLPKRQILYDDAWEHGEIDFLGMADVISLIMQNVAHIQLWIIKQE